MAATLSRLALFGLLSLAAAACSDDRPRTGEIALNDAFRADFDLVDQTGAPATDERFEGEPMLIYFGFTSCPDVCPTALGVMSASLDALGRKADEVQPLFITVDPERDTPERLARHLAFDTRILGLTGDEEAVREAREAMKVFAAKVPLQDSAMDYTVDHQSMFFLTDADGKPVVALDDAMSPEDIAAVISRYL